MHDLLVAEAADALLRDQPPAPRAYWWRMSDEELEGARDEYRALAAGDDSCEFLFELAASIEDDLARRSQYRNAIGRHPSTDPAGLCPPVTRVEARRLRGWS